MEFLGLTLDVDAPIPAQGLYAPVVCGLCSSREETARDTLVVVTVMCNALAAPTVAWAVEGARTGTIVTTDTHFQFLQIKGLSQGGLHRFHTRSRRLS